MCSRAKSAPGAAQYRFAPSETASGSARHSIKKNSWSHTLPPLLFAGHPPPRWRAGESGPSGKVANLQSFPFAQLRPAPDCRAPRSATTPGGHPASTQHPGGSPDVASSSRRAGSPADRICSSIIFPDSGPSRRFAGRRVASNAVSSIRIERRNCRKARQVWPAPVATPLSLCRWPVRAHCRGPMAADHTLIEEQQPVRGRGSRNNQQSRMEFRADIDHGGRFGTSCAGQIRCHGGPASRP